MAFHPRLTDRGMDGSPWWYSDQNIFYMAGYGLPNCTCYCYGRYAEVRDAFASLPTHDAKDWYGEATAFERGQTPRLGAVICFGSVSGERSGHVAIVEEIIDGGDEIVTSNSAYNGTYFYTEHLFLSNNYVPSDSPDYLFQGFIYNDAAGTMPISDHVIAALCGNFFVESQVNPGAWEDWTAPSYPEWSSLNKGYGLGQWTNTGSDTRGRLFQLHTYVTSKGYADGNGNGQLDFLLYENYWITDNPQPSAYTDLSVFLSSDSTDVPALVEEYMHHWEGNYNDSLQNRINAAADYATIIEARKNDDPALYHWVSKNDQLTQAETINNVMCVYFYLTGKTPFVPPTPLPGGSRSKFPIWLMCGYMYPRKRRYY